MAAMSPRITGVGLAEPRPGGGSPLVNGLALHADGSTGGSATQLNGYSVIQAEDLNEALGLVKDHPYLAQGRGYSIEAYRLP
jgi:hypothetical protein